MFLKQLWQRWLGSSTKRSHARRRTPLTVETLETRAVPASYSAANVTELIASINAANLSTEPDTITLAPNKTFTLTAVDSDGLSGLPVILAQGGPLTIDGNGAVIERSTARKTPMFRLFFVMPDASLTLQNMTLQGGKVDSLGGAIHNNMGNLVLTDVTVQKNIAQGAGGGIYSRGSLTLERCLIQENLVIGRDGAPATRVYDRREREWYIRPAEPGGWGSGGGVYVASGTLNATDTIITNNTAQGGEGGQGKHGQPAAADGIGIGGGLYITADADASFDSFTLTNLTNNTADQDPDIFGTYVISPDI